MIIKLKLVTQVWWPASNFSHTYIVSVCLAPRTSVSLQGTLHNGIRHNDNTNFFLQIKIMYLLTNLLLKNSCRGSWAVDVKIYLFFPAIIEMKEGKK